ncbi:oligosaccharide flippase family protein, partial [Enterococcus cecorum]
MSEKFKVKSVKYNLLMNLILKMSGVIFPLITFPYVSRVLLSEANGKIAFATSVVSYFSLVASMGIPSYGVRKCAEVRDNKNE